jgi:LPS O-antigen subunit length determinant protein (WzzB/FepE family)
MRDGGGIGLDRDISVGLDLNEVSHALKKRKWVVVVFTLLLTAAGIAYGFLFKRIYIKFISVTLCSLRRMWIPPTLKRL